MNSTKLAINYQAAWLVSERTAQVFARKVSRSAVQALSGSTRLTKGNGDRGEGAQAREGIRQQQDQWEGCFGEAV